MIVVLAEVKGWLLKLFCMLLWKKMYSSVEAFTKVKQLNCSECDSVSNSSILIVKTDSEEFPSLLACS